MVFDESALQQPVLELIGSRRNIFFIKMHAQHQYSSPIFSFGCRNHWKDVNKGSHTVVTDGQIEKQRSIR